MESEPLPKGFRQHECYVGTPGDHWRLYHIPGRASRGKCWMPEEWQAWTTGRDAKCRHRGSLASCIEFVRGEMGQAVV